MVKNNLFRSPVVAILGHVDHGKTTLLDFIRKSRIAEKEYGAITQRIGAYEIITPFKEYKTNKITFIDTPGHEAFSKLRLRGASVADIALLIIDAKDSVMPQTIESISHIQAAKIPFIVVINKIDLPDADPNQVKNDLLKYKVVVEEKGGKTPAVNISAKTGQGINELLELILLISSELDLQWNPENNLKAVVIENKKDKRGIVVSVIVKDGVLFTGQNIFVDKNQFKIRQIINDLGLPIKKATPSSPIEILGVNQFPEVGTTISDQIVEIKKTSPIEKKTGIKKLSLTAILTQPKKEKKLNIILKTDNFGSLETIISSLKNKDNVEIILASIGNIHRSDVFLAKTTKSIIIGFNTTPDPEIKELAKQEKILIKTYYTIYDLIEELDEVLEGIKTKEEMGKNILGEARILANFIINKEKIFGIRVTKGKIVLGKEIYLFRNEKPIGKTKIVSLKIHAKMVEEVKKNEEAGIIIFPLLDIQIGDVIKYIL